MDSAGILTTLAEVGIGLAGFSGIVAVLAQRGPGAEVDRFRLAILVSTSFAVVIWSFVPQVLASAGLSAVTVWQVTSGSYVVYLTAVVFLRGRQVVRTLRAERIDMEPLYGAVLIGGASIALLLQLANAISLHALWPHATALLWALSVGFLQFLRMLHSAWAG